MRIILHLTGRITLAGHPVPTLAAAWAQRERAELAARGLPLPAGIGRLDKRTLT